ncbi:hypothetical protein GCM10020258_40820 [Sphingomonas yabuuchiae]
MKSKGTGMMGKIRRGGLIAVALTASAPAAAESILFVGNSFTFGAHSPVMRYRPDLVRDLNREGIGGVPALFKTFAKEAGQDWQVSLETAPVATSPIITSRSARRSTGAGMSSCYRAIAPSMRSGRAIRRVMPRPRGC